jgi:hypothetical protein
VHNEKITGHSFDKPTTTTISLRDQFIPRGAPRKLILQVLEFAAPSGASLAVLASSVAQSSNCELESAIFEPMSLQLFTNGLDSLAASLAASQTACWDKVRAQ